MSHNQDSLKRFASTPLQRDIAALSESGLTNREVAQRLEIGNGTVRKALYRLRARRASVNPGTHSNEAPEGYRLRGVSTQRRDAEGNIQWVKTEKRPVTQDPNLMIKMFREAARNAELPVATTSKPVDGEQDMLAVFPLGDPHFGLIASPMTSGGKYDMEQSICDFVGGMRQLIDDTPRCANALIISVGDMYHADDETGATPRSKHKLDTHTIWPEVVQAVFECLIRVTDMALAKHGHVTVDLRPGNHDKMSTIFTQMSLEAYYRNEPRVTVVRNVRKVQVHVFDKVMIAAAHGDSPKSSALPGVVAHDFPEQWGKTRIRHAFVGHIHHRTYQSQDLTGMSVESLRIHGKRDAWTDDEGYRSQRAMVADLYHTREGHRRRYSVTFN